MGLSESFGVVLKKWGLLGQALRWRGPMSALTLQRSQAVSHVLGQASLFPFPAVAGRADGFLEILFVQPLSQPGFRPGRLFCLPDQPASCCH